MEPKLPMPNPSPEMANYQRPEALAPRSSERQPTPETPLAGGEREKREAQPQGPAVDPVIPPLPVIQQPALPTPAQPQVTATSPVPNTNPLTANDDDIIEKAWVDKAKEIVHNTRSDPYSQEKEVSKLQADYIKKRYGKDIKLTEE